MAENKVLAKQLIALAQLDIDAAHAYVTSIEHIDLEEVKKQFALFRADHERHVSDLSPLIVQLGGDVPTHSPDLKGFLLQGFTAVRSLLGNEQALKAMKGNEELTNKAYTKALEIGFPAEIRSVVQRNLDDEHRHLAYIHRCLEDKIWERGEKGAA